MRPSDSPFDFGPLAPLPGTDGPRRALFVDRWGTLLERPEKGWCARFRDARFTPGALESLFRAHQAGWAIYLLGNEESVALGRISDSTWERFESELLQSLSAYGVPVARNYACLDDPARGKAPHDKDSVFFLPNTGAMYHAKQHDGIDLEASWVIGDSTLELAAGWRAGCRLAGVRTGEALGDGDLDVEPEILGATLSQVVHELVELTRERARA